MPGTQQMLSITIILITSIFILRDADLGCNTQKHTQTNLNHESNLLEDLGPTDPKGRTPSWTLQETVICTQKPIRTQHTHLYPSETAVSNLCLCLGVCCSHLSSAGWLSLISAAVEQLPQP